MPGMDGHGLIRWVATNDPRVRSVFMSVHDIHCGDCPFEGRCMLLRKPFNPHDAVAIIEQLLSKPED
jgi:hypothetical protein